jgi:hypothetical protein
VGNEKAVQERARMRGCTMSRHVAVRGGSPSFCNKCKAMLSGPVALLRCCTEATPRTESRLGRRKVAIHEAPPSLQLVARRQALAAP